MCFCVGPDLVPLFETCQHTMRCPQLQNKRKQTIRNSNFKGTLLSSGKILNQELNLPIFPAFPWKYKTVGDEAVNASVACLTKNMCNLTESLLLMYMFSNVNPNTDGDGTYTLKKKLQNVRRIAKKSRYLLILQELQN